MAKKVVVESVEERKNRIKAYLQGVDPAVRFVAESGMGLKRLFSEEVLLPPEYDFIVEEGPYDKCSSSIDGLLELRSAGCNCNYFYMDLWGNIVPKN